MPDCAFDKVVIVCHGFASHKKRPAVTVVAEKLMSSGICAVTFDFPCHGSSKASPEALCVESCIEDILCLIRYVKTKYKIQDISLFGISFGGYVALNFALRYPQLISRVFLRAPAINMEKVLIQKLIGVSKEKYQHDGYVRIGYKNRLLIPYDFYKDVCCHNLYQNNQQIDLPIFIVHGKVDDTADIEDTYLFVKEHVPHAKILEIEDMNHVISVEQIEMVADRLINFLREAK